MSARVATRSLATLAALASLASLSVAGCGTKGAECSAFIGVINRDGEALRKASIPRPKASPKDTATTMRATADAADTLAADVAKVSLTAPELKQISTDYQSMAKDAAGAARELAGVLDKIVIVESAARAGASDPAIAAMMSTSETAAKYCAAHASPACTKLQTAMSSLSALAVDPAKLDAFSGELGAIVTKEAELQVIVESFAKTVNGAAAAMRSSAAAGDEVKRLTTDMQAAKTKLDSAIARESHLTKSINGFCSG